MKKTILFTLMVVGLTVSFFVGISVSQERREAQDSQKARNEILIQQAQNTFKAVQQRSSGLRFSPLFIDSEDSQDAKS